MAKRRQGARVRKDHFFKGRQFTPWYSYGRSRWYLMFPISYYDLEVMLRDRGVEVDRNAIFRRMQADAVEVEKQMVALAHEQ